jgi:hypothetical protein
MFLKKSLALCVPLIMSFAAVSSAVAQPAQAPATLVAQGSDSSASTTTTTTTTTSSSSSDDASGSDQDLDSTTAESLMRNRPYGATPEEAFTKARETELKTFEAFTTGSGTSFGSRALKAVCTPLVALESIPLKLNDQKVEGNDATLSYAAQKPDVDLQITAHLKKNDKGWRLFRREMRGTKNSDSAKEIVTAFTTQLPGETSMLSLAMVLLVIAGITSTVGSIWLIINAFRKHWAWGLGSLFFPIVQLVFVFANWPLAKKPFLVILGSLVLFCGGCAIPGYYMASSSAEMTTLMEQLNKLNISE